MASGLKKIVPIVVFPFIFTAVLIGGYAGIRIIANNYVSNLYFIVKYIFKFTFISWGKWN
jgi:hypothetical protein